MTKSINDALKQNRIDSIIFIGMYIKTGPAMRDVQKACKLGNVTALEYFYKEYNILPDALYQAKKPNKPKRAKNDHKLDRTKHMSNITGAIGQIGLVGSTGTTRPISNITDATGPIGAIGHVQDCYALEIAVENNRVNILQWLYDKGIKPTRITVYTAHKLNITNVYQWLEYINTKDNLGIM